MLPFLEKETNIACPRSSGNLVNDKFPCSISQSSLPPDLKQLCSCPSQLSERYVAPTSDSAGGLSDKALKPLFVRSYERPRGPGAHRRKPCIMFGEPTPHRLSRNRKASNRQRSHRPGTRPFLHSPQWSACEAGHLSLWHCNMRRFRGVALAT